MLRWLVNMFRKESTRDREYGPVVVQGRQLRCLICDSGTFWAHQIQLHTPLMTFLNLEEWNRIADCAVCAKCGHVHTFIPPDSVKQPDSDVGEVEQVEGEKNAAT